MESRWYQRFVQHVRRSSTKDVTLHVEFFTARVVAHAVVAIIAGFSFLLKGTHLLGQKLFDFFHGRTQTEPEIPPSRDDILDRVGPLVRDRGPLVRGGPNGGVQVL